MQINSITNNQRNTKKNNKMSLANFKIGDD